MRKLLALVLTFSVIISCISMVAFKATDDAPVTTLSWGGLDSYVTYHGVETPNLFDSWTDDGTNYTTTITVKNTGNSVVYNFRPYVQDNWGTTIGTAPASNQHIQIGAEKSFTISVPKSHTFAKIVFGK